MAEAVAAVTTAQPAAPVNGVVPGTVQTPSTGAAKAWEDALSVKGRLHKEQLAFKAEKDAWAATQKTEAQALKDYKDAQALKASNPFAAIQKALGLTGKELDAWRMKNGAAATTAAQSDDKFTEMATKLQNLETQLAEKDRLANEAAQQGITAELQEWKNEQIKALSADPKYPNIGAFGGGAERVLALLEADIEAGKQDPNEDPAVVLAKYADKVNTEMQTALPAEVKRLMAIPHVRAMVEDELKGATAALPGSTKEDKFAQFRAQSQPVTRQPNRTIGTVTTGGATPTAAAGQSMSDLMEALKKKANSLGTK